MRFVVVGRDLQRLLGRRHRVVDAVLPQVETGELGDMSAAVGSSAIARL